ncbi:TetR/AcrR family transcriptional regulator [Quadrisphaera sp. DSM 44207]|uniref:TetR/AcrR family transcriptional regulator n=1 Tax=Quadrisphaera sp. DSM 44207 TaxID=1881057 RepID=UPI000B828ABC|nr:TetR/AcrR family transcriptional regulator [Quadrisphaera sp. DSM 44207]
MTTTDAGVARSPRGRAREEAILAAAVELVSEVGYERLTCDAIAARARASKATIYRRWSGKAELVADALRRQAQGDGPIALPDTGSLRGDLLAAVRATARAVTGTGDLAGPSLLGLVEAVRDDPVLRAQVRSQIEDGSARVGRDVCARAAARGELLTHVEGGPVVVVAVAHVLLTTLLHGAPPTDGERAALVDTVLLPLLGASPRPSPSSSRGDHR